MKIDTKQILEKGTVEVIVKKELEKKLEGKKQLKIKLGIDPSGADLHLGHMVVIRKLREFQIAGHKIFLVFGNFTGQIGDPSDKLNTRQPKSQKELEKNAEKYLQQVAKILDITKTEVAWNADWLNKLNFGEVTKLAQVFTVQQMLERDMYQQRIKKSLPIHMHEFLYPLMQGYDSFALQADVEIGGTDQTFNLLAGRTIQKAYNQRPQSIVTVPILIGIDGKQKMGKSLNNYIGINETPDNMFGKVMSIPDELLISYFELTTDHQTAEILKIKKALQEGENPRNLKLKLAKSIVQIYHTEIIAAEAEKNFINIFSKNKLPENIVSQSFAKMEWNIVDLIFATGLCTSKGEIRRNIQGGGVKINGEKISDPNQTIDLKTEKLLQIGKRRFLKIHGNESITG